MRPTISWYFFNLFRLVAVVFMGWALAAQFIALVGDLGQLSNPTTPAANLSNSSSTNTSLSRSTTRPFSTAPTNIPTSAPRLITNSILPTPTPLRPSTPTVVQLGPEAITTTPPLIRPTTSAAVRVTPVVDNSPLVVAEPNRRSLGKRAEEVVKPTSGVIGLSSVPTSTGGPLFASMSRMIMASALVFLLLAQLGVPEMWLYKHVPAFGPQSTPLWLGVGQVIIAVEGLRVYSIPLVWAAHAGLLVIGMINSHMAIGLILLARRRKLPKSPPPPLYFSRTTRLLFFRPLPACYIQLLSKEEQEHIATTNLELAQANQSDPETGDGDLGPWKMKLKRNISGPIRKPSDALNDVRRGGYPTFARGGMGAAGSQIPPSTIDVAPDGRMRGLIARPFGDRKSIETTGDAYSGFADIDSRAPSRADTEAGRKGSMEDKKELKSKRKPPPLGLDPSRDNSYPDRRQLERQRSITAIKEKIHQRMEKKGSDVPGVHSNEVPTITTTAPSAGFGQSRQSTVDSANTFGRKSTILRSIPKRGNTISHASVLPPAVRPHLPERSSSQSQVGGHAPVPIAKSPTKSIAESAYSSSLPWAKSKPGSPVEPVPSRGDIPEQAAHRASRRQTSILPPARNPSPLNPKTKRESRPISSGLYNATLVGAVVSGDANPSNLQLPVGTVTRTPSGSKLQKARKADAAVTLRLPKPPTRSDSTMSKDKNGALNRQVSLGSNLRPAKQDTGRRSPNTLVKKRASPSPIPISPASPTSSPPRPQSAQSVSALQSSLRSSLAPLDRSGSVRSTKSTRTAMGVRFDLEKRYSASSSSDDDGHENLLSPETNRSNSTPRSAGFRIPGTKFVVPFGTPRTKNRPISEATSDSSSPVYDAKDSDLILEMDSSDDEIEAARPESFASQSTIGSMKEKGYRLNEENEDRGKQPKKSAVGERAGLPKRAASIAVATKPRKEDPVLGGQYMDGGTEGNWTRGHMRRPSSISIDTRK